MGRVTLLWYSIQRAVSPDRSGRGRIVGLGREHLACVKMELLVMGEETQFLRNNSSGVVW